VEGIDADGTAPGALWSHLTKWMKNLRNILRTTFQIVSKKVNKRQLIEKKEAEYTGNPVIRNISN
jgi:hypothetical protein